MERAPRLVAVILLVVGVTASSAPATLAAPRPVPVNGVNTLTDVSAVIVVHFRSTPNAQQRADVARELVDWFNVGADGGYGGFPGDNEKGVLHDISAVGHRGGRYANELAWYVDLGSAGPDAFVVLARMLAVWNEDVRDRLAVFAHYPPAFVKFVSVADGPTGRDCKIWPVICK